MHDRAPHSRLQCNEINPLVRRSLDFDDFRTFYSGTRDTKVCRAMVTKLQERFGAKAKMRHAQAKKTDKNLKDMIVR